MTDAFHRRIERDWNKMPRGMRVAFRVAFVLQDYAKFVATALMVPAWIGMFLAAHGLLSGAMLMSKNPVLWPSIGLAIAALVIGQVLPVLANLAAYPWYYRTRGGL